MSRLRRHLGAPVVGVRSASREGRDWARVIVASIARGLVATLIGMAFWAAAPAVIGWHPTTVMTGSMMPRLHPGDIAVSVPVLPSKIALGKVVLFDDPDHPGELRLHRYVDTGPGKTLVTKGDANPQNDSTPVKRSAVRGVAMLRIPWLGLPNLWIHEGRPALVGAAAVGLLGLLFLTSIDGSLRRGRPVPAQAAAGRLPVRHRAARGRRGVRRGRGSRGVRAAAGAVVILLVAGAAVTVAPPAAFAAKFTRTTSNPASSLKAATAVAATTLTCSNNSDGSTVTLSWTYPAGNVTPATFSLLYNTTVEATAPGTASSLSFSYVSLLDLGGTYAVKLRTDLVAGNTAWTATSTASANIKVVALLGITVLRCG